MEKSKFIFTLFLLSFCLISQNFAMQANTNPIIHIEQEFIDIFLLQIQTNSIYRQAEANLIDIIETKQGKGFINSILKDLQTLDQNPYSTLSINFFVNFTEKIEALMGSIPATKYEPSLNYAVPIHPNVEIRERLSKIYQMVKNLYEYKNLCVDQSTAIIYINKGQTADQYKDFWRYHE